MIYDVNIPAKLGSTIVVVDQIQPPLPPPSSVVVPNVVSYQFQVVEYTDKNDKVVKVELQVQQTEHDNYGNAVGKSGFKAVPRIKKPLP